MPNWFCWKNDWKNDLKVSWSGVMVQSKIDKKQNKRYTIVVETVYALDETQQNKLHEKLKEVLESERVTVKFSINPKLLGGMTLQINSRLVDLSVVGQLKQFQTELKEEKTNTLNLDKIKKLFLQRVSSFEGKPILSEVGKVLSVSDGIARVSGLDTLIAGERVEFESGAEGIAFNLNAQSTDVVVLENADTIREGDEAYCTGKANMIPVGMSLLGRVVSPLGRALDNKEKLKNTEQYPVFAPAPGIIVRDKVKTPIQTGIKAIDALVPIGRGQRELIIGDRQTGKTTLILDTIINQKNLNEKATTFQDKVFCIYVAIGQKQSTVRDVVQTLQKYGAMDYTVVVSATASDSAAMQYLAPYAGCAIGEYFRNNGMHAVVFYDDLSKHAVAYREMSLLLKRPAGREAYPGDVFYLHSRLLERSAQLNLQNGGGSLTAIPVIETQEGDVSAYIPTNVISITDGQIFLESSLFHQGVRPAVNVGLSVSRVGSAAQSPLMKQVSSSLKLELSQYREVLGFAQLSSDLDATTQALLNRGSRLTEIMKQTPYHPLNLSQEVLSLYVGVKGYLDDIPVQRIPDFLSGLLAQLKIQGAGVSAELEKGGVLSPEIKCELDAFIQKYISHFFEAKQVL